MSITEKTQEQIAAYLAAGLIYNVDWNQLKESINRQLSNGYKQAVTAPYLDLPHVNDGTGNRGVAWEIVNELYYGQGPQIHANMDRKIAKLEKKFVDHWMVKAAREYLESVRPVIEDANKIKATITKARKPREGARKTEERTLEHTGTCSVCERNVKRDAAGDIVDHGYRIAWQERQGGCYGVKYPPIELSPKGAENYLSILRPMIEAAEAVVADFAERYTESERKYGQHGWEKSEQKRLWDAESTIRHAGHDVKRIEKRLDGWVPTDLPG